ncbi:O-glucosyltransferase rumi [Pleurostoma richardsiae]|uniref:O-glucosyltransferase rumi n=1 Tax=Pleurostoma richardsiae TaxID=41990 RepID=A0AA38S5C6_9PEZI|nr:O-glucosyltransferase rumi [Pleurostoma richardsiae]
MVMRDKTTLSPRRMREARQGMYCLLGSCMLLYFLYFTLATPRQGKTLSVPSGLKRKQHPPELLNNLSLTEEQCSAAFPGLTWPIDDAVAMGSFELEYRGASGPVIGRIKDNKLYIISAQRNADLSQEMINSRTAALAQLHRALLTSPAPLPDAIFALNIQDQPFGTAWTYSRQSYPPDRGSAARAFLMPHFSFWAWPLPFVGSVGRAAAAAERVEAEYASFTDKIPRAAWRGTSWYGSVQNPRLRANLLAATKGKEWADVEALVWDTGHGGGVAEEQAPAAGGAGAGAVGAAARKQRTATNAMPIEDFCRYRYVLHTEGITYSGRFQFLQMCASVMITPPIAWMQHTTHLVRPLFSSSLDLEPREKLAAAQRGRQGGEEGKSGAPGTAEAGITARWKPSERVRAAWPVQHPPEEANIVFVAPDWSDLEQTVMWLEAHPKVAAGIASRQREMFVGGGYFSPAAETCYWRALVRGWSKVVRTDGESWQGVGEGMRYEEFSLTNGA